MDDPFTTVPFTVYGGLMYFTINPPNTYYYETSENFFLFIKSHIKNTYYVIMDNIFDDDQNGEGGTVQDFF